MKWPFSPVRQSALNDLRVLLRVLQIAADLREGLLVDHRAQEVPEVARIPDLHLLHHRDRAVADLVPERLRHVDAARRRALLPLVFEAPARDRDGQLLRIRGRVRDDEVLAAGFSDDARIGAVAAHVLAGLLPHAVEDRGAAREVNAAEVGRIEQRAGDLDRIARQEVDDARREAGGLEQLVGVVAAQHRADATASRSRCSRAAPGPSSGCRRWR